MPKKYLSNKLVKDTFIEQTLGGLDNKGNRFHISTDYLWKNHKKSKGNFEERLFDIKANDFVIKNNRVAGTENWVKVNGQQLYNQGYHPNVRAKIVDVIHGFFLESLKDQEPLPINFPITIHYHFECQMEDTADVDNYALPYYKCFQDCLVKSCIIYNDTRKFINGFKVTSEERKGEYDKLTVKIYANRL